MTQLETGLGRPEGRHRPAARLGPERWRRRARQNDAAGWYRMVKDYQDAALDTRLGIPMLYGVDAVHGHNNVLGRHDLPAAGRARRAARRRPREADRRGDRGRDGRHRHPLGLRAGRGRAAGRPLGPGVRGLRRGPGAVAKLAEAFITGLQGDDLTAPPRPPPPPSISSATAGPRGARRRRPATRSTRASTDVDDATFRAIHLAPVQDRDRCGRPDRHGLVLEHRPPARSTATTTC